MSFKLVLADGEMDKIRRRFLPSVEKMHELGNQVKEQIARRFDIEGDPSGLSWKSPKVVDDGRALLRGMDKELEKSFQQIDGSDTSEIFSSHIGAIYAQLGTKGKGGKLPNIRAKKGPDLFIPLTEKARATRPVTPFGIRQKRLYDASLVRGRIKNGQIVPQDADFVYVPSVSIPAREILPVGTTEIKEQIDLAVKVIKGG